MDECLIHSIFQEHVTPGRVPFGRPGAPPPSPPPHAVTPIDRWGVMSRFKGKGSRAPRSPLQPASPPRAHRCLFRRSFPLTMLDKATCVVNKRPKVDWFLEEVASRFETCVHTSPTPSHALRRHHAPPPPSCTLFLSASGLSIRCLFAPPLSASRFTPLPLPLPLPLAVM